MQGHPGCSCKECNAGVPHKLLRDVSPRERAHVERNVERALTGLAPLRALPESHEIPVTRERRPKAKRFGGNTRQPWEPRPARTAA
jgi:hypothetical protein